MKFFNFICIFVFLINVSSVKSEVFQTGSEQFVKCVKKLNSQDLSKSEILDIVSVFDKLRSNNYQINRPIFYFYDGKVNRLAGRTESNIEKKKNYFLMAIDDFTNYKDNVIGKNDVEYKAAVVMLAYTYADFGNLTGAFDEAKQEIDGFLTDPKYQRLIDGSVRLCKADIYNADGFFKYNRGDSVAAVEQFKVSCDLFPIGWPIFANNYINACLDAFDVTKKMEYLKSAKMVYLNYINQSYWKNNSQFSNTGQVLEKYLRKNKIKLTELK